MGLTIGLGSGSGKKKDKNWTNWLAVRDFSNPKTEVTNSDFDTDTDCIFPSGLLFYSFIESVALTLSKAVAIEGLCMECPNLWNVNIDAPLAEGADYAFKDCPSLDTVTLNLPSVVQVNHIFEGCTCLTSLNLDLSSAEAASYAFYKCSALESLTINLNSLTFGEYMFEGCNNLETLVIAGMSDSSTWNN